MMARTAFASRTLRLIPLAVLVTAGGCFATRNDVRVVQTDIASMRTELLKNDAEQRDALTRAMRTIQMASDTVAAMSSRLYAIQGNVAGGLRNIDTQLITVQELLKQSASTISRLRAESEIRANQVVAPVPIPPPGVAGAGGLVMADTTSVARPMAEQVQGPNELYTAGVSNLTRGSVSTARNLFQELLDKYPTSDRAPAAQLNIATTYVRENNQLAALTAYSTVIAKYPEARETSTALYKKAQILVSQGKNAEAKPLLQQIITRFKTGDEYDLANDMLKKMP